MLVGLHSADKHFFFFSKLCYSSLVPSCVWSNKHSRLFSTPQCYGSLPGLPTVQFWSLAVCKNGGKAWLILSHEWRQCLPRQTEGGRVPDWKNELEASSCSFCLKRWSFQTFAKQKNILLLFQNEECIHKMCSFDRGLLHPSVDLGRHQRHSHDKMDQAFPPFLHTASNQNWMLGRPEANGFQQSSCGAYTMYKVLQWSISQLETWIDHSLLL